MVNNKKKSVCLFCSLGCGVAFKTRNDQIYAIDYDKDNPVNMGALCPRGYYNIELLNHPQRLTSPQIGTRRTSWSDAIKHVQKELKGYDPSSIAILLSSISTNEDAYMAAKMAKWLGTKNISGAGNEFDIEAVSADSWEVMGSHRKEMGRAEECDCLLIIGDLLTRSPVLAKRVNQVKYGKRGNQVIVIDPDITHTSWFATTHLRPKPGTEAVLMAAMLSVIADENKREAVNIDLKKASDITGIPAETIRNVAVSFDDSASGCIMFCPGKNKQRNDLIHHFTKVMASYSMNKQYSILYGFGNTIGVNTILDAEAGDRYGYGEMIEKMETGKIKAALIFGEDITAPVSKLGLVVRSCFFKPLVHDENTVMLPQASHMERKGSVTLSGWRSETITPIAHKVGGRTVWKIISQVMEDKIGFDSILNNTARITLKGPVNRAISFDEKVSEALKIKPLEAAGTENITHFGANELARNFFWWRANNKHG